MVYLLSDGAGEHEGRDFELREFEVESLFVVLPHDIHVNKVLHIILVQGD